jgi:D-alanine-D-alanine ligase
MDKDVTNCLMRVAGLPIVPFVTMSALLPVASEDAVRIAGTSGLFMKSANMGSSVDKKILIEPCVPSAREIECSVLEDAHGDVRASELGEIVPDRKRGFYSDDAKCIDAEGTLIRIPGDAPKAMVDRIKSSRSGHLTFSVVRQCHGWDFFLSDEQVFVNETNTLPGFTNVSMHPKLWVASGLPQSEPMTILIAHALTGHGRSTIAVLDC